MRPTDRSGVPYRRRAVNCQFGMYQAVARLSFRLGCGKHQIAIQEQEQAQKRRAGARYHQGSPTFICCFCDGLCLALILVVHPRHGPE